MACQSCDPELAPTGPRQHDQHFGVRFADWGELVFKDGVRIDDCYEVDVAAGLAWRFVVPLRYCECWRSYAAYIDTGRFRAARPFVSRAARAAIADRERRETALRGELAGIHGLPGPLRAMLAGEPPLA